MLNTDDVAFVNQPMNDRYFNKNLDVLNKMMKESSLDILFDFPSRIVPSSDSIQHSITMRMTLIDWLKQINTFRKSKPGVVALTIEIIDRYLYSLSCRATGREVNSMNYQCIGAAAYFMSSKLEEVNPVSVLDMSKFTSGCCSISDIMDMEIIIAFQLDFNVKFLTPVDFIYFLTNFIDLSDKRKGFIRRYAIENYLYVLNDSELKKYSKHIIAINCIILGYHELDDFTDSELKKIVKILMELINPEKAQLSDCYDYLSGMVETKRANSSFEADSSTETFLGQ